MRLGIDLGGTGVKLGLVNEKYEIIRKSTVPTGEDHSFEAVMDTIGKAAYELLGDDKVEAVGIGIPSSILKKRIAMDTPNLDWKNCDVAEAMEARFDAPCTVGNDADCAALGEFLAGSGAKYKSMMLFTLGTGVGGSFILEGKVLAGMSGLSYGTGIEPGHMKIIADGELCGCGRKGCLEAYASATALKREIMRSVNGSRPTVFKKWIVDEKRELEAKLVFDAKKLGDEEGERIYRDYIHYLAIGVSNSILTLRPEAVVIGGGISLAGDLLFKPLIEEVREITYCAEILGLPDIIPATLGNNAGLIGAAFL